MAYALLTESVTAAQMAGTAPGMLMAAMMS
jgi:hypothetical protein